MLLPVEVQAEILTKYFSDKRSVRSISREMGVDRKTVRRLIERRKVETSAKISTRVSLLDPHKESIREFLRKDPKVTATSILNYLRTQGYVGGFTILKSFCSARAGSSSPTSRGFFAFRFCSG